MKSMKKLVSFVLVLVLTLSMGITAFAANDGSITIANATVGKTYSIYKLFDATIDIEDGKQAVTYYMEKNSSNPLFVALFGADGTTPNPYFSYTSSQEVLKHEGVNDTELIAYLTSLINDPNATYTATATKTAEAETVSFTNLPYGYYIVKSSLGTTVTIDSNTPAVTVLDKNQKAGVLTNDVETTDDTFADSNTKCFGESFQYRVTLDDATNYDGENQINFYSIYVETGAAIHPDFTEPVTVKIGGQELTNGFYIALDSQHNKALGNWIGENYQTTANWYLIQMTDNDFRISIPWRAGHTLVPEGDGYRLDFADNAASEFASPVDVVITYSATLSNNAAIGGKDFTETNPTNTNTAHAKWYFKGNTGSTLPDTTHTYVYGIGLVKEDTVTKDNLADAQFEVYTKAECSADSIITFETTQKQGVYLHETAQIPDNSTATTVVTPINGKIVLLGLKAGEYWVKETKAPAGYNGLKAAVQITVGEGLSQDFAIYADANGKVVDSDQDVDGYTKYPYNVVPVTIGNSQGVELPSTGGAGTTMLIAIGSMMAIAFAIFLITHKKMSVYVD